MCQEIAFFLKSLNVGETLAESSLTQSDLACEIHITQRVNSHLRFKHSFNITALSGAVNWSDAVNRSRYFLVKVGSAYGARPVSTLQQAPSQCLQTIVITLMMRVKLSQPPAPYLATPQKNLRMMTSTSLEATRYDNSPRY